MIESWLGVRCPLTWLEVVLREQTSTATYTGSFIAHWGEKLLYYQAAEWVFVVLYTIFGAAVTASWFWVKPGPFSRTDQQRPSGSHDKPAPSKQPR